MKVQNIECNYIKYSNILYSFVITAYFGIAYKMLASNFPKIVYRCVVNIDKRLDNSPENNNSTNQVSSF